MAVIVLALLLLIAQSAVHGDDDLYVLKKHVEFFDQNLDGFLYIPETIEGFKSLGVGALESAASAVAIHTALSAKTRPVINYRESVILVLYCILDYIPSQLHTHHNFYRDNQFDKDFPIVIDNIKLARHTSDSGVYDEEGRFVPEKFGAIFTNHAHTKPDALNSDEVDELLKSNRKAFDFKNWLAASTEWKLLYKLGKDADGFLPKENIRNVYDGSFFYQLAKQRNSTAT